MQIISINNYNVELTLIGVKHTSNKKYIKKLITSIKSKQPDLILIEGNFDKADFKTKEQALKFNEMGYISYYSKKQNIKIKSNDPSNKKQHNYLKNKFGNEKTITYFRLRNNKNPEIKKEHQQYFNPLKDKSIFNQMTRDLNKYRDNYMLKILKKEMKNYKKIVVIKGEQHIKDNLNEMNKIMK